MLLVAPVAHAYAPMTPQQEALFGIDKLNVVRSALHVRSEPIVRAGLKNLNRTIGGVFA